MKTMLQHDPTMMTLSLAGTNQRSTADLPSWCPDWRSLKKGSLDCREMLGREWLFIAANEDSRRWSAGDTEKELLVYPQQDWRILRIKGTMIGVIRPGRWTRSVGDHLKEIEAGIADESMETQESHRTRLDLPELNMHFEDLVDWFH